MTTNEYLIKRILELEEENKKLNATLSKNKCVQDMINKVSDAIDIQTYEKEKTLFLVVNKEHNKDLYNTCVELFDLKWKEEKNNDNN